LGLNALIDANAQRSSATSVESSGKTAPATFGRREICSTELNKLLTEKQITRWLSRKGSAEWYKCSESFEQTMSAGILGAGRNRKAIVEKDTSARYALCGIGIIYLSAVTATS